MKKSEEMAKGPANLALLYGSFALSGASALIYELSWQRLLLRVLGSTLPAVTLVLCVFMTGIAIGSFGCGKLLRGAKNSLRIYGFLELGIGLLSATSVLIFSTGSNSIMSMYDGFVSQFLAVGKVDSLDSFNPLFWSRALYASLFLIVPTTLMGSTFPCVSKFLEQSDCTHETLSQSYAVNLAGAAVGTVLAGFLLLPSLGLSATIFTASAASVVLGLLLVLTFRDSPQRQSNSESEVPTAYVETNAVSFVFLAVVVFLNGAVGMSLEVIWSRLFSLLVGSSTYSVASVFAISIIGLALGAWLFRPIVRTVQDYNLRLAVITVGIAASLFFDLLFVIQNLPWLVNLLHQFFAAANSYYAYLFERILVISMLVMIPAIFCGGIFPVALAASSANNRKEALGQLYAISSIGSIVGAGLSGFLLIPLLGRIFPSGMESSICILITLNCMSAFVLFIRSRKKFVCVAPIVLLCCLFICRPSWNQSLMSSGIPFLSLPTKAAKTKEIFDKVLSDSTNNKLLFYREGLNTTVTVSANRPQNIIYLKNDGKVEAALPFDNKRAANNSDLSTQTMLGTLPVSVAGSDNKKVFVVGLGSGATCGGVLMSDAVKKLVVAEIEPTIFEINHFFEHSNGDPLRQAWVESGRVQPFCGDARLALNFSREKFDAIISQPAEPWVSGCSDLYTKEFWTLAKSRLTKYGVFCQWIQLYSIDPEYLVLLLRTFQNAFPNTYVFHSPRAGEIILLGSVSPVNLTRQWLPMPLALDTASLKTKLDELSTKLHQVQLNTDDNLLTEYALPERLYLSEQLIDENLKTLGILP